MNDEKQSDLGIEKLTTDSVNAPKGDCKPGQCKPNPCNPTCNPNCKPAYPPKK